MNSDMVKTDTAERTGADELNVFRSFRHLARPSLNKRKLAPQIPSGLPIHKPKMMPIPIGDRISTGPPSTVTPALARAKTGMMT